MGCRFYGTTTLGPSLQGSRGDPARSESLRTPAHVARGLQALLP